MVSIKSWASCGVDPALMGLVQYPPLQKSFRYCWLVIKDVDLLKLMKHFGQSIAVLKTLSIPEEKVNVNGGAIAIGHPIEHLEQGYLSHLFMK